MTDTTRFIPQNNPPQNNRENLPTMYDLPSENLEESGLPDEFHFLQPLLLFLTFLPVNWNPELVYSAVDINLYYDVNHVQWYKRPDWFGVVGVPRLYKGQDLRLSYVTWQEESNPFVVVELLSPGTEEEDLGETENEPGRPPTKWDVYEQILQVPYYIIFSRYTNELKAFQLVDGRYEAINITSGRLLVPDLGLSLGLWYGSFQKVTRLWLRWYSLSGELIPVSEEQLILAKEQLQQIRQRVQQLEQENQQLGQENQQLGQENQQLEQENQQLEQEKQQLEQEKQQLEQEKQQVKQKANTAERRAEQLAERLRQLGINPDE
jgi:Uma2 family endonuclease